jgi:hypothetical protein
LHEVKRSTDYAFIVAIKKYAGCERISIVKLGEDAKLTTHIMSGFHLGAKGRTTQDHFAIPEEYGVSQVRMAAGELAEGNTSAFRGKMAPEERLEFG